MTDTRVALVTGGGRGIGRAISLELARTGHDVAVGWVGDRAAAEEVATEVRALGRRAALVQGDAAVVADCERNVADTVAALGRLDVLVANAGIVARGGFLDLTPEDFDRQLATNARGSFFVAQAAARQMIAQGGGGRIILVTSRAGEAVLPGASGYCVSKAAQRMVMMCGATELAQHGITVNAVAPGTTETDINRDMLADPEKRAAMLQGILLGRFGVPDDICGAAAFLASDQASWITGITIHVSGGAIVG
jgi:NAD(P)-dependent dehydrogenase (short-subunit alcohol dehydrogenase family)